MWYLYAIIATFLTSGMILMVKYATLLRVDPRNILFVSFLTSALFALAHSRLGRPSNALDLKAVLLLTGIGGISYAANLLLTKSVVISPNAGYTQAIANANVILITLFSAMLFRSDYSLKNILGSVICVIGVVVLVV